MGYNIRVHPDAVIYFLHQDLIMATKLTPMKVKRLPLEKNARTAIFLIVIVNLAMWLSAVYYNPEVSGTGLFLLPAIYTTIMAFFLLVLYFRYTFLENYPYLLSLPSFIYRLAIEKNVEVHGEIINKVFTVWCIAALYLSVIWAGVVYFVFSHNGKSSLAGLLVSFILIMIALTVITVFALYRSIYRSFVAR
ncbi:Uncharacterised protein [uncultured archaeon]|nr:Uncharacterised protein [uncultured archaeon]